MGFWSWAVVVVAIVIVGGWIFVAIEEARSKAAYNKSKWSKMGKNPAPSTPSASILHGTPKPEMVCPHCQVKGQVLSKLVSKKAGISGGKATGALLTGGVSLIATGLSRKEQQTEAHCKNCASTWHF